MRRIDKPSGLIRYDSARGIADGSGFRWTAGVVSYSTLLVVLMAVLTVLLINRSPVDVTILRTPGMFYQEQPDGRLSNIYDIKLLNKSTFSEEHFVTLFYGELTDDRNGLVIFANCGHNNPILYRAATGTAEYVETTGQIMGPFPNESFKTENFLMNTGDVLFLYTDGF